MTAHQRDAHSLFTLLDRRITAHDFAVIGGVRTAYLQAQLHGNETTGALVLHALVERYRSEPPPLSLRLVPHSNPFAWDAFLESGEGRMSKPGGRDWNRIFEDVVPKGAREPADAVSAESALRERLWSLSESYDVVIDLHTPEFGLPHVYIADVASGLNTFHDLPHVIYGDPVAPSFDEAHVRRARGTGADKRVATLELPSNHLITAAEVAYWADRVHRELASQACGDVPLEAPPVHGEMVDLIPQTSGLAMPVAEPGQECAAGDPVLRVVSHDGSVEELLAPATCVPVCYRRATMVKVGRWAVRVIVRRNSPTTVPVEPAGEDS